jgi:hypothetical protein
LCGPGASSARRSSRPGVAINTVAGSSIGSRANTTRPPSTRLTANGQLRARSS